MSISGTRKDHSSNCASNICEGEGDHLVVSREVPERREVGGGMSFSILFDEETSHRGEGKEKKVAGDLRERKSGGRLRKRKGGGLFYLGGTKSFFPEENPHREYSSVKKETKVRKGRSGLERREEKSAPEKESNLAEKQEG